MTRVHDMGGRFGDGPVTPSDENVVFDKDWHKRALALTLSAGFLGQWNIDTSRHARERLSPKDYAHFSYYEKWVAALADLLVEKGLLTREELTTLDGDLSPFVDALVSGADVPTILAKGGPADRPSDITPRFGGGDYVCTKRIAANQKVPGGHTRLPIYAAGARGQIVRIHGTHVLPDASAHGLGDQAEPLYAVAFEAGELWANPEHPDDTVVLDLWQSYLEPLS